MSDRIEQLLAAMTLDEKASLTAGVDMWHGHAAERLGVPALKVSDGPVGVRGDRWVASTSACAPCGTALGATWNPDLLVEVGRVLGDEARSKGVDIVLAPTVNLHRNPLAGRNFECFSEDPHLSARAAVAVIDGMQSTGVGACVKHFVANDSEYQRHTISSDVDERTLRELYLVPFEAAVTESDVVSVMSGYNRLNGTYCAQHRWLLTDVLRGEWGFDGIVISDWWGTQGVESLEAGLDLEMPGPPKHLGPAQADRVRAGELDESVLDDTVRRLLRTAERLGLLDAAPDRTEHSIPRDDHAQVLRRAATEGIVLLRNDAPAGGDGAPLLPLDASSLSRVAVIGPNADVPAALGGGSAAVNPHHTVTMLDGLRAALPEGVEVVHEIGVDTYRTAPPLDVRRSRPHRGADRGGLTVDYFDNRELAGEPVHREIVDEPRLSWIGDVPAPGVRGGDFSVRVHGTFVADVDGAHTFALVTGGTGGRVSIDGRVVLDNFEGRRSGTAFFGLGSAEVRTTVECLEGDELDVVAEFVSFDGLAAAGFLLGHVPPIAADGIARAVEAARSSDVAIVVVGLNQDSETEGEDRTTMALPGEQGDLVAAVVAANPRTVVLVNAGSVVDLSSAADAPALAQTWYLGQETGPAVADVLLGNTNPSGRLPMTYGARLEDWPSFLNYPGDSGHVLYGEQLFMGYRGFEARGTEPAFCFGHGLGYTRFEWSDAALSRRSAAADGLDDGPVEVRVTVTNTGDRRGAEVVQCYVHDEVSTLRRPEQELRSFAKVELDPGESATVSLTLSSRAFAAWDPAAAGWVVEPGRFEVRVAASSQDVRAALPLELT